MPELDDYDDADADEDDIFDPYTVTTDCPKCEGEKVLEREVFANGTSSVEWDDCDLCEQTGFIARPDLIACLSCYGQGMKITSAGSMKCGVCGGLGSIPRTDRAEAAWEELVPKHAKIISGFKAPNPDQVKFL